LRAGKLLWFDWHYIATYRLSIAERVRRNSSCGCGLVAIMNVVDGGDVCNVRDVDVGHIGDVHLPQVDVTVVVPGKERLTGTERKPSHQATNAEAYRKQSPT
jgi:predicted sugar kinase